MTVNLHQSLIKTHLEQARRYPIRYFAYICQGKQALMYYWNWSLIKYADKFCQDGDFLWPLIEVANAGHIWKSFFSDIRIHCFELLKQWGRSRFLSLIGTLRPDVLLLNDFSLGQHNNNNQQCPPTPSIINWSILWISCNLWNPAGPKSPENRAGSFPSRCRRYLERLSCIPAKESIRIRWEGCFSGGIAWWWSGCRWAWPKLWLFWCPRWE